MGTTVKSIADTPRYASQPALDADERDAEREAILDAAFEMLAANGYSGVKMHLLATRVQLSMRRIYGHFISKSHLLFVLYEREVTLAERRIQRAVPQAGPLERLDIWVIEFLRPVRDDVLRSRAMLFTSAQLEIARETRVTSGSWLPASVLLRAVADQGVADGTFDVADVSSACRAVESLCSGAFMSALTGGDYDADTLVSTCVHGARVLLGASSA